jgi:predicted Zn finger-like uncharacterized protein
MQVTCTNCRARYAVDPLAIGPSGRIVQCARCNDRWFQTVKLEPPPARSFDPPPKTDFEPAAAASAPSSPAPSAPEKGPIPVQPVEPTFGSMHRPVSPFSHEAMADNFPRFAGPRPSPGPSSPGAMGDRGFIDTMPIPDVVIRPSVKGAGLPALIEPRTSRHMSIVLAVALLLIVAAGAAVFVFRAEIIALLPAEWRTMLRLP